jgi:hypothetical protein
MRWMSWTTGSKVQQPSPVENGHKWSAWDIIFENYITSLHGVVNIPLDYVIRHTMPAGWMATNAHDLLKYALIHTRAAWNPDSIIMYHELKLFCMSTPACDWISEHNNTQSGSAATRSLQDHYKGARELNKQVIWAHEQLATAHYKSKYTFPFKKFATLLQKSYTILASNGEVHGDNERVRVMLSKMEVPNNAGVEAVKCICSSSHGNNLLAAVTYLSAEITNLFPAAQLEIKSNKHRKLLEIRCGGGG